MLLKNYLILANLTKTNVLDEGLIFISVHSHTWSYLHYQFPADWADSLTTQSLATEMKSHSSYHWCLAVCFSFTVCTQVINLLCSASSWHITWHRKIHQQVVKHAKYFQSNELPNKALLRRNASLWYNANTHHTARTNRSFSSGKKKGHHFYHFCSICRKFL